MLELVLTVDVVAVAGLVPVEAKVLCVPVVLDGLLDDPKVE